MNFPGISLGAPLGLLGLLALPVIVLLHLLFERNVRHLIPSLQLWSWLEQERRGPRPRRLPITWILVLQLAAAALLSLALARPVLEGVRLARPLHRLIVIVDTSVSMGATDVGPTRLAWAQVQAGTLLARLGTADSAAIITAGPRARIAADSEQAGLAGALAALAALAPEGVGHDWDSAFALATAASRDDRNNQVIIFSDGAFAADAVPQQLGVPASIEWRGVGGPQPNQAVVTLAARSTGSGAVQLFARLANFSDDPANRTLSLTVDGQVLETRPVGMGASGTLGVVWTLPPAARAAEVALDSGDVLPADDRAAASLPGAQRVPAVVVAGVPEPLAQALHALPDLDVKVIAPDDYVPFQDPGLTVLRGWLPERWPQGGVLVFDPPPGSALLPVQGAAPLRDLPLPGSSPLMDQVDLAHVVFGPAATLAAPDWLQPALVDGAGTPLAYAGAAGSSQVLAFTFVLSDTNLPRRPAFPILLANAVEAVLPQQPPGSLALGGEIALPPADWFLDLALEAPDGSTTHFGDRRPGSYVPAGGPGLYTLTGHYASGVAWQARFGANAGAFAEADLREPIAPAFGVAGSDAVAESQQAELWPWLAALALALVLVEAHLAWR